MEISVQDAAELLGKNDRQIRYLVKSRQVRARMVRGKYRIDVASLPLTPEQRLELLGPEEPPAAEAGPAPGAADAAIRLDDVPAWTHGEAAYRHAVAGLGAEAPVTGLIREALEHLACALHALDPGQRAEHLTAAQVTASRALVAARLDGPADSADGRALAETLERDVLPALRDLTWGAMVRRLHAHPPERPPAS